MLTILGPNWANRLDPVCSGSLITLDPHHWVLPYSQMRIGTQFLLRELIKG